MNNLILNIAGFEVGNNRPLFIAEIGNNHNGSFDLAIDLVDRAKLSGADCVKFQMRDLRSVYRARSLQKTGDDLGVEYVIDLLERFELTPDIHRRIAKYCNDISIPYLCTPWDPLSINILEDIGVPAYKVASADLTNLPLIRKLAQTGKPLILSTGMSVEEEIRLTVSLLNSLKASFVLLHCNSAYPAPFQDINLNWMSRLKNIHPLVGYSGHERGISVSLAAVALGACIVERHFTINREMEGPDHAASLLPAEFAQLVRGAREVQQALGSDKPRALSQGEMINRESLGKSLVTTSAIPAGTVLTKRHIKICSPGQGLSPQKIDLLLGRTLLKDKNCEDFFFLTDVEATIQSARSYKFKRPWGLPVRYYDFNDYTKIAKPDFWEFHLSYSDMELNISDYINSPQEGDLVVHAPELLSRSRLLDLASPDESYRLDSVKEMQRVINITRSLKNYFPKTQRPLIVTNIGGFSMDSPLNKEELQLYYERFADSLQKLEMDGVELIPQTMAPFPWHFGGQRFQNLFMTMSDILEWCSKLNLRVCFDVSHSMLTCNHLDIDFYEFAKQIAPITAHLHIGDALGVNGEGLQIGNGEIDFDTLGNILSSEAPNIGFIPEIWQGHKNNGAGFWSALESLKGIL